jgi:RNA polymerase sigma factor (sigma-70 family)
MSTAVAESEVMEAEAESAPVPVDVGARNALVEKNLRLVRHVAKKYRGRGLDLEDMVGEGYLGLITAAEKFDPGRGVKFSTYASYWIAQTILKSIGNTSRPVRVPLYAQAEAAEALHRAASMRGSGDDPYLARLDAAMDAMGLRGSRRKFIRAAAAARTAEFGAEPVEDQATPCPAASPLAAAIDAERRDRLALALARLPEGHRAVLSCRYGLDGGNPLTYRAMGRRLGIARDTAAQRTHRAHVALRRLLKTNPDGDLL